MQKKIVSRPALERILEKTRGRKKVVFTNGCFDVLHLGHVRLLEKAKTHGDILVLGLNSDASVRKLKGPKRPLVPERERAELLSALTSVDYICIFPEETPAELIRAVIPDVLIKGGDYKISEIIGRDVAKKIVRFPVVQGRSTTNLIEKIVKAYGRRRSHLVL
jgi:D-beta-D-heptose 7-phosphate kinase/D-beta-D-heptose 1-phosphate adenosyltransferase